MPKKELPRPEKKQGDYCGPAMHEYAPLREGYYGTAGAEGEYLKDKTKVYQLFYCIKCAHVIERLIVDKG